MFTTILRIDYIDFSLILTNPGVLPRSTTPFKDFIKDLEEKQIDRYCFTCWIPKTSSSHHCSQCDKCVDGFDHHCPWIHKCVYRKNLRAFVFFCLTIFMFHVFYVLLLLYMIGASMNASGFGKSVLEQATAKNGYKYPNFCINLDRLCILFCTFSVHFRKTHKVARRRRQVVEFG